jgi:CRISPR-associated protein Cas8a1/Csx13
VAWSAQQKTRTDIEVIEATEKVFSNYKTCSDHLTNRWVEGKNGMFIAPSFAREIIAENLARGLPWFSGFAAKINNSDLFKTIRYESKGLYQMIQDVQWDLEAQKLFVTACHEALRHTYAKIYGRTKEGEYAQIDRENERLRAGLGRCKNAETFRQFITDFWSRAGKVNTLRDRWQDLLPLVTGEDWKMARDLTLLALASYPGKEKSPEMPEAEFE